MIAVSKLCYHYPKGEFALHIDNLTLEYGVCTAITGKNGSGKTTLGKLLAGILKPDSGSIKIAQDNLASLTLGEIGQRIGYLFQEPARQLFAPFVLEELTFVPKLKGIPEVEAEEQARKMLALFSLSHLEKSPVLTLSRGEKQRLALCAVLMNNPRFLILDEPTTGLDVAAKEQLSLLLEQLVAGGTGIALISHDKSFLLRHAVSTIVLGEGALL